jgi:excinuclease UvrABC ATPase subunit
VLTEDELIEQLAVLSREEPQQVFAPLLQGVQGSHRTLLATLDERFERSQIIVDGSEWDGTLLSTSASHSIELEIGKIDTSSKAKEIRELAQQATAMGAGAIRAQSKKATVRLTTTQICSSCGAGFRELRPTHFNQPCPYCKGTGCDQCDMTGMHPQAASVRWEGMRLPELVFRNPTPIRCLGSSGTGVHFIKPFLSNPFSWRVPTSTTCDFVVKSARRHYSCIR